MIKLNDMPTADIMEGMQGIVDIHCGNCDKIFTPKRAWQGFCCSKCRNEYHQGYYKKLYNDILHAQRLWMIERDAFIKEISELKQQLIISK